MSSWTAVASGFSNPVTRFVRNSSIQQLLCTWTEHDSWGKGIEIHKSIGVEGVNRLRGKE